MWYSDPILQFMAILYSSLLVFFLVKYRKLSVRQKIKVLEDLFF